MPLGQVIMAPEPAGEAYSAPQRLAVSLPKTMNPTSLRCKVVRLQFMT